MHLGLLIGGRGLRVGSFRVGAELALEMGYDFIELAMDAVDGDSEWADLGPCSYDEAMFIADDVRAAGVDIAAIQCHTSFVGADEEAVERNLAFTQRAVDYALAMGAPLVHAVTGPKPSDLAEDDAWAMAAEAFRELLEYAAATPVRIAVQPQALHLVGGLAAVRSLLDKVRGDALGLCLAPHCLVFHRDSVTRFLREFGDRVALVRGVDAAVEPRRSPSPPGWLDMGRGEMFRPALPGAGALSWDEILAALREAGFEGVISVELGNAPDQEQAARDAVKFFRRLMGQI